MKNESWQVKDSLGYSSTYKSYGAAVKAASNWIKKRPYIMDHEKVIVKIYKITKEEVLDIQFEAEV